MKISALSAATLSLATALFPIVTGVDDTPVTESITLERIRGIGTVTLEDYGAVGDGTTDDSTALGLAIAALSTTAKTLLLGAKTYFVPSGGALPAGCSIIGLGTSSVLKTNAASPVLTIGAVNDILLQNFKILGNGAAGSNAHGIKMGLSGVGSSGPSRVTLVNVTVENMWASNFAYFNSSLTFHEGPKYIGCHARGSANYGFRFEQQGEYVCLVACKSTNNNYGLYSAAGNINWTGGEITNNAFGVWFDPGTNDSHCVICAGQINHNTTNVYVGAIVNGLSFTGCHFYSGNIQLVGSLGVRFNGGSLSATNLTFDGSLGTVFDGVKVVVAPSSVTDNANGHPSQTRWINCTGLNDETLAFVADRVQVTHTFSSDADETLSLQESTAETIILAAGTWTSAHDLTIPQTPADAKSRRRRFVNNNGQSVHMKFSTGTAFTLTSGSKAWIGSDGTNAIEV